MTPEEFAAKLRRQSERILKDDTPLRLASYSSAAAQCQRIFERGQTTSGGSIGQYNTTDPLYLNPNGTEKTAKPVNAGMIGFPRGKTGKTHFANGEPHKTVYFESYADYRQTIKRPIAFINLDLSGDMFFDFASMKGRKDTPKTYKISDREYVSGFSRQLSSDKANGAEDRFGVIFKLQKQERENFTKDYAFEMRKMREAS